MHIDFDRGAAQSLNGPTLLATATAMATAAPQQRLQRLPASPPPRRPKNPRVVGEDLWPASQQAVPPHVHPSDRARGVRVSKQQQRAARRKKKAANPLALQDGLTGAAQAAASAGGG
eukprot:SAG22_NODE_3081_length_1956_cov_2.281099_1_plen_116_part_10